MEEIQASEGDTISGAASIRSDNLKLHVHVLLIVLCFFNHLCQASGPGWGSSFAGHDEDEGRDEDEVTTAEAEEEYKRVFAECLENNFDLDLATKTAKAAMRAALNIVDSEDEESEGDEDEDDIEMEDLMRGITVIEPPRYS